MTTDPLSLAVSARSSHGPARAESGVFLALSPASAGERRFAYGVIALSLLVFVVLAPFAKVPLARIEPFIPAYEAALLIVDLLTAAMFLGQAHLTRSRALLPLAGAYLFAGLMVIPHALTFPGLFAPRGLIGATSQSTAWIYMFWHGGFPLFLIAYTLIKDSAYATRPVANTGNAILLTILAVIALVLGTAWFATSGSSALPEIMNGNGEAPAMTPVVTVTWVTGLVALVLLWRRRTPATIDLWLMVTLAAWLMDVALSAVLNQARFDLGFYSGRLYGIVAASTVLAVLLLENNALYLRLADSLKQAAAAKAKVDEYARLLEGRVEASEETHRRFIEEARDGILALNADGMIAEANRAAALLLGRTKEELVGKLLEEFIPEARPGGSLDLGNVRVSRPDGKHVQLDLSVSKINVGGSDLSLVIARDVTERDDLQRQLQQAQKMESIGQLTGGMAHDFNNLLTVVMGNLELLLEGKIDEDTRTMGGRAMRAAQKGADLTKKLLAFARRQPLAAAAFDADELVRNTGELLRRTLGEQVTLLVVPPPHRLWRAFADSTQTESAITNLAVNARDAMPNGGRITIETANATLEADYAALNPDVVPGDYVMLAVSDTGTGIPPAILARVFEPFFATKAAGKGTGLGLAMVYGFAKQSKGHVKIYSEIGHGTTVRLYLPRAPESASAVQSTASVAIEPRPTSILLVEDNPDVRTVATAQLRAAGCKVTDADSGPAGLEMLQKSPDVDILVTDMVMPGGMTGLQLAREALMLRPTLRVLFISGFSEAALQSTAEVREIGPLLPKPFTKADLLLAVRRLQDER